MKTGHYFYYTNSTRFSKNRLFTEKVVFSYFLVFLQNLIILVPFFFHVARYDSWSVCRGFPLVFPNIWKGEWEHPTKTRPCHAGVGEKEGERGKVEGR